MAQILAPYHNGMRLGQGFNSYTQQICLDNAVLPDTIQNRKRVRKYYIGDPALPGNTDPKAFLPVPDDVLDDEDDGVDEGTKSQDVSPQESTGTVAEGDRPKLQPWIKPQIVTYSSRFVDKLKDVTESMNISGALSIQTGTIGGKGSGSYVDSDKFKESDINFHLQVKVVNQIHKPEPYTLFNKITGIRPNDFTAVYGDCFISGWEEGGELNAVVSIKVTDKSKIFEIKASLEAEVKGAVSAKLNAEGEITKKSTEKSTETTIAVNWSGGGSIKEPVDQLWTIDAMTKAAAAFPDLVAMTPQRTYAILTKYSALESFQRQIENYTLLDYENATIYTNMLMEHFMDYKMMWKQISQAEYELERGTAKAEYAEISDNLAKLAVIKPLPDTQLGQKLVRALPKKAHATITPNSSDPNSSDGDNPDDGENDQQGKQKSKATEHKGVPTLGNPNNSKPEPTLADLIEESGCATSIGLEVAAGAEVELYNKQPRLRFRAFEPSFAGLISARKVCRAEMAKIVNEVDLVTQQPKKALDVSRDQFFLDPLVYRQLLPVVRSWSDDMLPDSRLADAPVILGYSAPVENARPLPSVCLIEPAPAIMHADLTASIAKVKRKAKSYRMVGLAGCPQGDIPRGASFFNDLEGLDPTYRPSVLEIFKEGEFVSGIQILYTNGQKKTHGKCDPLKACWYVSLLADGSETVFEMRAEVKDQIEIVKDLKKPVIKNLKVATSLYNVLDTTQTATGLAPEEKPIESASSQPPPTTTTTPTAKPVHPEPVVPDTDPVKQEISTSGPETKVTTEAAKLALDVFLTRPDVGGWSLRGFFGWTQANNILSLGIVWGRDKFVPRPLRNEVLPLTTRFLGHFGSVQKDIRELYGAHPRLAGRLIMGELLLAEEKPKAYFNDLSMVENDWRIKDITFATEDGKLVGLQTKWTNGKVSAHGRFPTADNKTKRWWNPQIEGDLVSVKMTAVSVKDLPDRLQTIEFVKSEKAGGLPSWLLDTSLLRYMGDGEVHALKGNPVVESAPTFDSMDWRICGFYGFMSTSDAKSVITGLGVIWGRD